MEGNCVDANSISGDPATLSYSGNDFVFEVKSLKDFPDAEQSEFDALLEAKWREAMNQGLFRFAYNPGMPQRRLCGKLGFFLEVNGERHSTRRPPPAFASTRHPFDPSRFHFGRAPVAERLFRLSAPGDQQDGPKIQQNGPTDRQNGPTDRQNGPTDHCAPADGGDDWVMINVSPIGRSHVLLVPRLSQLRPQRLEPRGLQLMLHCLLLSRDSRVVSLTELILDRGLAFNLVATRGHPSSEALDVLTESSIVESLRSVTEAAFDQVRSLVVAEALPKTSAESTGS
ncbi:GDP-D-glucose phosphorylase 1 [Amphibalanus amphitrite]|uniref:GDP-D-glucose phosphorylase 1 n=1 Tax=Amphibalanus amphitrite TaxID=1232801 RepID=A0A6A4WTN8_AMPAM|nr:GDP-D-glucose phosphorylase 1 [Amphibalanus amphitrite]